jgi:hypothetical protein
MKRRRQKISESDNSRRDNRAELEGMFGVQSFLWINENEITGESGSKGILEQILSPDNLRTALQQVVSNKGAGGIDRMEVSELKSYIIAHYETIRQSLLSGTYKPQAVRRVEIPKGDGKKRQLGISTVLDRWIQQAIQQYLTPIYEQQFSGNSYGFRPKRSAHQALCRVQDYVNEGYIYAVDMDLTLASLHLGKPCYVTLFGKGCKKRIVPLQDRQIHLLQKYMLENGLDKDSRNICPLFANN